MMSNSTPRSNRSPCVLTPSLYMMSNSATLNGAATLFLRTVTRVRLPITSLPCLIDCIRRISIRTLA